MKHMIPVLAIAGIGIVLAGLGGADGRRLESGPDGQYAGPDTVTLVPMLDDGTLPEGHPPLPGADAVCPYRGLGQNPTPGSETGPRADDAPIIST